MNARQFRSVFFILVIALSALTAVAQPQTTPILVDGVSFDLTPELAANASIQQVTNPHSGPAEAPYTEAVFYHEAPIPQNLFEHGGLRVYQTADLLAQPALAAQVERLRNLLDRANQVMVAAAAEDSPLPFLPLLTHGQALVARVQTIETQQVRGVRYLTAIQAVAEPFTQTSFYYTFQGFSGDGEKTISAVFPISAPGFPAEFPTDFDAAAFMSRLDAYLAESAVALERANAHAFEPALPLLDDLILTLTTNSASGAPQYGPLWA